MGAQEELARIEALPKDMLVPTDICKYLGCCAYSINVATRDGKNPFPLKRCAVKPKRRTKMWIMN